LLRNLLKISLRNLRRHRVNSLIAISGMSIGMAVCILVGFYVWHELSYDRFHTKADRIYRLVYPTEPRQLAPLAPLLEAELPEVEKAVRVGYYWGEQWLKSGDIEFQTQVYTVDEGFFDLFDFPFVRGTGQAALVRPNSMVISTQMAQRFFGDRDPVGETLVWMSDDLHFEVTGVFELPRNTHFPFHFIINAFAAGSDLVIKQKLWSQRGGEWYTYLLLSDGYDTAGFGDKVNALIEEHAPPSALRNWLKGEGQVPYLQPLASIHLDSDFYVELEAGGDRRQVAMLAMVALMVLAIACINYANLVTARARTRAREVGVRRAVGGTRRQLTGQFLGESMVQSLLALAPAWLLARIALPSFNAYAGTDLSFDGSAVWITLPLLGGAALMTGALAGLYPALLVSAFRPAQALTGKPGTAGRGAGFWRVLVVFQFAVSILFIGVTAVVRQQLEYMHSIDLGLNKEQVITLTVSRIEGERRQALMEQIARVPGVAAVARFRNMPSERLWRWTAWDIRLFGQKRGTGVGGTILGVDGGYLEVMQLKLLAGGGFVEEALKDNIILNETAARRLGFENPRDALGQRIHLKGHMMGPQGATVRGVVVDFHFESLHHAIGPVALYNEQRPQGYIGVRTEAGDMRATLARIEETWRQFEPEQRFVYHFLDEQYGELYHKEERLGRMLGVFSLLVIVVGCGGIFALAASAAQQRTKEIGVRKVLGATAAQIALLLSREFTWLVVAANVVAFPVVYWATRSWLSEFPYPVSVGPGVLVLGGIMALLVAWFTVGGHVLKAARQNPVDALRYE
jgi:putative ABC transport system permease protein